MKTSKATVAVVGATGLVGQKLTELLSCHSDIRLRLFANNSAGKRVPLKYGSAIVERCEALTDKLPDFAMFMTPNEVAAKYVPQLVKKGVTVIDNSSFFRLKKNVPLVVNCVNGERARGHRLIANPNCSTIQTVVALNPLKSLGLKKLTAVTYQSVSGAGRDALGDLYEQRCYGKLKAFRHPIYDNLIPQIGDVLPNGSTTEERKLTNESRKILQLPRLKVNGFCVRVPVSVCHGVFVNVELQQKVDLDQIRTLLKNAPNVLLLDDASCGLYPMPLTLKNTKYVGVGRIAKDPTCNGVNMFVVADNLLRGAAYNAYEILLCKLRENKCL